MLLDLLDVLGLVLNTLGDEFASCIGHVAPRLSRQQPSCLFVASHRRLTLHRRLPTHSTVALVLAFDVTQIFLITDLTRNCRYLLH